MKTRLTALLLAGTAAFALVAKPAYAGDKEAALIGGFLGGLVLGAALDHDRGHTTVVVRGGDRFDRCDDSGYWDYRTVRVWVPGCWETRWRNGCSVRVYIPGYWDHRRERVWVARRGDYGRGRDHDRGYDRGHDRGHDRRRHDRW